MSTLNKYETEILTAAYAGNMEDEDEELSDDVGGYFFLEQLPATIPERRNALDNLKRFGFISFAGAAGFSSVGTGIQEVTWRLTQAGIQYVEANELVEQNIMDKHRVARAKRGGEYL